MKFVEILLKCAGAHAVKRRDRRTHVIGALGIRRDGAVVLARNGPCPTPTPSCHAEARLVKKLDVGSVVYVAKVNRDGLWGTAKPCKRCARVLRSKGVREVFFTLTGGTWGSMRV